MWGHTHTVFLCFVYLFFPCLLWPVPLRPQLQINTQIFSRLWILLWKKDRLRWLGSDFLYTGIFTVAVHFCRRHPGCADRWASAQGTKGQWGPISAASSIASTYASWLSTPSHHLSPSAGLPGGKRKLKWRKNMIHVSDLSRVVWEPPTWTWRKTQNLP